MASHLLAHNSQTFPTIWPQATHISENEFVSPVHLSDIVVPSYVLPDKIHNEDAHYSRLAVGFLRDENERQIPLRFNDPELEAIFCFQMVVDFMVTYAIAQTLKTTMSYGKYIK